MNCAENLEMLEKKLRADWNAETNALYLAAARDAETGDWTLMPLGEDRQALYCFDAKDEEGRQLLVQAVLQQLLLCYSPAQAEIWYYGADAEALAAQQLPGTRCFPADRPEAFLDQLHQELHRRHALMAAVGCRDYAAYCFRGITGVAFYHALPRLIVLTDRWDDLAARLGTDGREALRARCGRDGLALLAIGRGEGPALPGMHRLSLAPAGSGCWELRPEGGRPGILYTPTKEETAAVTARLQENAAAWRHAMAEAERRGAQ